MNQEQLSDILTRTIALTVAGLSDLELAALNNCVQLGIDPHGRLFDYTKVAALFTEADGTRAHMETKDALARVVLQRLGGAR